MKTILLVEDDKTIVMGLEYSLQQEGYGVICCYNAKDAEKAVREQAFDLALLDLSLPDGSGYDICRLIRSGGDTPVVFLTARDEEVNVVMGLDMGADDYVTKPFRVRELMSAPKNRTSPAMSCGWAALSSTRGRPASPKTARSCR